MKARAVNLPFPQSSMGNAHTSLSKLLAHFNVERPGDILWAHAVNSKDVLEKAVQSPDVMMIEGDISFLPETGEIIMAHPPRIEDKQTYEDWLEETTAKSSREKLHFSDWITAIIRSQKGAKLDLKDPRVITPCLNMLRAKNGTPAVPIFLSADILQGPGGSEPLLEAQEFISLCNQFYPDAILSLGWVTGYIEGGKYEHGLFEQMLTATNSYNGHLTLTLRACYLKDSLKEIRWLLQNTHHTLTVWANEPVSDDLAEWIERVLGRRRVFYDIDTNLNPAFR